MTKFYISKYFDIPIYHIIISIITVSLLSLMYFFIITISYHIIIVFYQYAKGLLSIKSFKICYINFKIEELLDDIILAYLFFNYNSTIFN